MRYVPLSTTANWNTILICSYSLLNLLLMPNATSVGIRSSKRSMSLTLRLSRKQCASSSTVYTLYTISIGCKISNLVYDCWLLIVFTRKKRICTDVRRRTVEGSKFWLMVNDYEDFMDYIPSGYKLYENKGAIWKYGQVLTKIQNNVLGDKNSPKQRYILQDSALMSWKIYGISGNAWGKDSNHFFLAYAIRRDRGQGWR